jgi:cell wall-associated NlpC family hydrolase/uncharacterized coiled-coil protein SlyX
MRVHLRRIGSLVKILGEGVGVLGLRKQLIVSLSSALVAATALIPQAKADTLADKQQRVSQLKAQASQMSSEISKDKQKADAIQNKIDQYQSSIDSINRAIAVNQRQVDEIRGKLDRLMNQIEENKKQLAKDKENLKEMLQAAYEYGQVPYLEVLFKATSWDDLLSRLQALSQVSNSEKQLADKVEALQAQLQKQEQQQEASFRQLRAKTAELQALREKNVTLQNQQIQSLAMVSRGLQWKQLREAELQNQIGMTQSEIDQLKQEAARTLAEEKAQGAANQGSGSQGGQGHSGSTTSSAPSPSGGGNLGSANASDIVAYAESFIGYPYVWGATGPNAFDCSGLVQYVFARFGIQLPRTSFAQYGVGVSVSKSDLRPGDLVFFSTDGAGASHVGIYVGGGCMVSAQSPRSGVKEANIFSGYWATYYLGARRVIN